MNDKLKIFFDTEFTGLHRNTSLISIGLISESGTRFYAEFNDYNEEQVDPWIKENVIDRLLLQEPQGVKPHSMKTLLGDGSSKLYHFEIGPADSGLISYTLQEWLSNEAKLADRQLQMCTDCYAYDWVLFNDLICKDGKALNLPEYIHYIPIDLSTYLWVCGFDPDVNREEFAGEISYKNPIVDGKVKFPTKHNSLWDAIVIKACFDVCDRSKPIK